VRGGEGVLRRASVGLWRRERGSEGGGMKLLLSTGGGEWKDSAALAKYYIITFCHAVTCIDYPNTKIMNMVVVACGLVKGCG